LYTKRKQIVCTPIEIALAYMLHLQYLNHLGKIKVVLFGQTEPTQTLTFHHRVLNHKQPRFGWKPMPHTLGLRVSPKNSVQALRSGYCNMQIYYMDDARCKTKSATHLIYMFHTQTYVEMSQQGPFRYHAQISYPHTGITLSRTIHKDGIGIQVYKTTTLRALATHTLLNQSVTRTWLCFYSTVVAYLPFNCGPVP
jgi:hypothetical protein